MSSHIGAGLICSFAPKTPHYYAHFRSKNFVGKKNSHIQGKSAVYPAGLTSILTQDVGIFLRQNRVRMCALWLTKGLGVKKICEHLGIDLSQTIAFGDNFNDFEMLKTAGPAFAMENSPAEFKKNFEHIAPSNDSDGIYKILCGLGPCRL